MKILKKAVLRILLAILVIFVIAAAYLLIFHLNDIKALYVGFSTSTEDIENKIKKNDEQLINTINDYGLKLTDDDVKLLNDGTFSEEQITQILLGNETAEQIKDEIANSSSEGEGSASDNADGEETSSGNKTSETSGTPVKTPSKLTEASGIIKLPALPTSKPSQTKPAVTKPSASQSQSGTAASSSDYEKKVAELVAKMYVLKSQYSGQVSGIVNSMKADYAKLPSSQQTAAAKSSIASSYMNRISALEAQCDAQVNTVVTELRKVLTSNGQDTSLAESILSAYAAEKENTKAYYVNKYSN